ncbi:MAG: P-II family nitrogen regulator [Myxococcota bacterium]|jgi:nitrogen regulatory protein P-II 1
MKMNIASIRPERLEAVEEALKRVLDEGGHDRITVDTVEGHGRQAGEVELFRGKEVRERMVEKKRVMVSVNEAYLQKTIDANLEGARPGKDGAVGDGKMFVVPLEDVIRIRTGERGQEAI